MDSDAGVTPAFSLLANTTTSNNVILSEGAPNTGVRGERSSLGWQCASESKDRSF